MARLLSPEGFLVGVTITPWMRDDRAAVGAGAAGA